MEKRGIPRGCVFDLVFEALATVGSQTALTETGREDVCRIYASIVRIRELFRVR